MRLPSTVLTNGCGERLAASTNAWRGSPTDRLKALFRLSHRTQDAAQVQWILLSTSFGVIDASVMWGGGFPFALK